MSRQDRQERQAVIAGTHAEALDYIRRVGLRPRDLYYVSSFDQLDGLQGRVLLVGRWHISRALRHARALEARGTLQLVEVPE